MSKFVKSLLAWLLSIIFLGWPGGCRSTESDLLYPGKGQGLLFRLDNGVKGLILRDPLALVSTMELWVAMDNVQPEARARAHLLEHLLVRRAWRETWGWSGMLYGETLPTAMRFHGQMLVEEEDLAGHLLARLFNPFTPSREEITIEQRILACEERRLSPTGEALTETSVNADELSHLHTQGFTGAPVVLVWNSPAMLEDSYARLQRSLSALPPVSSRSSGRQGVWLTENDLPPRAGRLERASSLSLVGSLTIQDEPPERLPLLDLWSCFAQERLQTLLVDRSGLAQAVQLYPHPPALVLQVKPAFTDACSRHQLQELLVQELQQSPARLARLPPATISRYQEICLAQYYETHQSPASRSRALAEALFGGRLAMPLAYPLTIAQASSSALAQMASGLVHEIPFSWRNRLTPVGYPAFWENGQGHPYIQSLSLEHYPLSTDTTAPTLHVWQLDNGLNCSFLPMPGKPILSLALVVRSPANPNRNPSPVIADLLAGLLENDESQRKLQSLATVYRWQVESQRTTLFVSLPAQQLALGLSLLKTIFEKSSLAKAEIDDANPLIWARHHQSPIGHAWRQFRQALGQSTGLQPQKDLPSLKEVVESYRQQYRPTQTHVFLAGDLPWDQVARLVQEHLGKISPQPGQPAAGEICLLPDPRNDRGHELKSGYPAAGEICLLPPSSPSPSRDLSKPLTIPLTMAYLFVGCTIPPLSSAEADTLDLQATWLNRELWQRVVYAQGLAYNTSAFYEREGGIFAAYLETPPAFLPRVRFLVNEALQEIMTTVPTETRLKVLQNQTHFQYLRAGNEGFPHLVLAGNLAPLTTAPQERHTLSWLQEIQNQRQRFSQISPQRLQQQTAYFLQPNRWVWFVHQEKQTE